MNRYLFAALVAVSSYIFADVRVVPVLPTPESTTVQLFVNFPEEMETYRKNPAQIQMRLRGFPLGLMSSFERAKEIRNSKKGQTIHLILDNEEYVELGAEHEYTFDQARVFYDRVINYRVPYILKSGQHILRAFPTRSYGESLKDEGSFDMRVFFMRDKGKENTFNFSEKAPLLTYNEPQGTYVGSRPILLDFYVTNCRLSQDGYKVHLSIDGKKQSVLTRWIPYYIYGLPKGKHEIKIELYDASNKYVKGAFNSTTRTITVQ